MRAPERPVILLGHGVRLAGADVAPLLELNVPTLTSWPAADLVDSDHEAYFGRPGVYGQRCANKVLAGADFILSIGCRLSVWTVGYDFPRNGQEIVMVDVEGDEAVRVPEAGWVKDDAKAFISRLRGFDGIDRWRAQCHTWRLIHPWLESPTHDDGAYINPHRFMSKLQAFLRPDEVIVADCATGSLCAHQILKLKPPQRLMTSGGLGEMGCGLPGAIGASFARGKGEVICLNTDGSMMLNLQELQTIAHHRLPVKIIVFANDGYGMIRATQRALGMRYSGVDSESGVSCPNFVEVARSFKIRAEQCLNVNEALTELFWERGPMLLQVNIDPEYQVFPKVATIREADGTIRSAPFDRMSPEIA